MACSKYQYVKKFEQVKSALLQTYIVVRIDGRSFTKFCQTHQFEKPNDIRAINLMNRTAQYVCQQFKDIFLAYGQSDEYSFALVKQTQLFSRRVDKILSCIVSAFSSGYVFFWKQYFPDYPLKQIPMFDSRAVLYPNEKVLKDYFRWRQVDCHINNLYNTLFWSMIKNKQKKMTNTQVENILKNTNSGQKNEILFNQYGINYSKLEPIYRRGTIISYQMREKVKAKNVVDNGDKNNNQIQNQRQRQKQKNEQQQKSNFANNENDNTVPEQFCQQTNQQIKVALSKQANKMEQKKQTKSSISEQKLRFYKQKNKAKLKKQLVFVHQDCIKQQFWSSIVGLSN